MASPVSNQPSSAGQAAQASSATRTVAPQDFNAYAPSGGVMIMTYNPNGTEPGTNQKGTMTTQRFDGPQDLAALKDAIARLEQGKGNPGETRIATDGQGWNEATPAGSQALDALRRVAGNWSAELSDKSVTSPQPRTPPQPAPPKLSPLGGLLKQ